MEYALIIATSATRVAAAWLALRLFNSQRQWRFAIVTFVLSVTALFPIMSLMGPRGDFFSEWLISAAAGIAMLLTALILVRTLTDLTEAHRQIHAAKDVLEDRVADRTAKLRQANQSLQNEIVERRQVEKALRQSELQLRDKQAELRQLTRKLIAAQEDERRRLARELHDHLSQSLAALALELASLQQKVKARDPSAPTGLLSVEASVTKLAEDIHDLSRLLHPSILDDLGLEAAIRAECERFSEREGVEADFTVEGDPPRIDGDAALTLYRVAQEALHNISKHAQADSVSVLLRADAERMTLRIEDTGCGFDIDRARRQIGLGLVSMAERVELDLGRFQVESVIGKGSVIQAQVPLNRSFYEQAQSIAS